MGQGQGLVQKRRTHEDPVKRECVVEDHGPSCTQSLYRAVPAQKSQHRGDKTDVEDGSDRLQPQAQRDVVKFDQGSDEGSQKLA